MKLLLKATALILFQLGSLNQADAALRIGDSVCITGYVMDHFCIERGTLLDNRSVETLKNPEEHSFHCLLDVGICAESGYQVLGDKDPVTGMHSLGYRLDDTDAVLEVGRATGRKGYCSTCTGDSSSPDFGYKATVRGTVADLGDGSDGLSGTPMLTNFEMMSSDVACERAITPAVTTAAQTNEASETAVNIFDATETTPETAEQKELAVGDEVCITSYIVDNFCIERGTFLDNDSVMTLVNPEEHSFHCLLDVDRCKESGYQVIGDKNPDTGMHCLGFRLDDTDSVVSAGQAYGQQGYCTTCTGDASAPEYGWLATVKGTVSELGDGSNGVTGTPVLTNIEILSSDEKCEKTTVPPKCLGSAPALAVPAPTSALSPSAEEKELAVGDEVCITSYIVDNFCIERGTFLDNDSVMTLVNPEEHSFHCLLDVDRCKDSGYQVIGDKNPDTGMHCLGFRLDDTDSVVSAGQAYGQQGYCTTCTGDASAPEYGWLATVKGTVSELGDGSNGVTGTPMLTNIEILSSDEKCEKTTVPPMCIGSGPALVDNVAVVPAPAPAMSSPEIKDCSSDFCENQLADDFLLRYRINVPSGSDPVTCEGCTITMQAIYDGDAWVSIAFSKDGSMIGSEAVIGIPGEVPMKYILGSKSVAGVQPMSEEQQTLTDAVVSVNNGQTTMEFTKIMAETNEIEITTGDNNFLWAYGSSQTLGYHANRAAFVQNLSTGAAAATITPNYAAWLAHGVVAFLAWGMLSPFAVGAAVFRKYIGNPLWFKLHRAFNSLGYAFTVVAFAIAVAYYNKEGGTHFDGPHQKMGLAMFVIASLQVIGGIVRPHAPKSGDEKAPARKAWEMGHRIAGLALLLCGVWQMREGIALFATKYSVSSDNEDKLAIAYWVWIGIMIAVILLGAVTKFSPTCPADNETGNQVKVRPAADDKNSFDKEDECSC